MDLDTGSMLANPSQQSPLMLVRERLLAEARQHPIIVVEAPSGYGKTAFAQSWLSSATPGSHCIWISLDESARDPAVFLDMLIKAGTGRIPHWFGQLHDDDASLAIRFERISALVASGARPLVLVLDNVHHLEGTHSRTFLARLLAAVNLQLRILIATNPVSLDIGLGALSAIGKVHWINAEMLAFTLSEIEQLSILRQKAMPQEHLLWLHRATQGWPVLVQLAMLMVHDNMTAPEAFVTDGPVREYLYHRFLSRLGHAERDLMWTMACIGRGPMRLLLALHKQNNQATTVLRALVDLGIVRHEPGSEASFQLNPLVRATTLRLFGQDDARCVGKILIAGANWYRQQGMGVSAVRLLLEAGTGHLAVAREWLLELGGVLIFRYGQHQTLLDLEASWRVVAGHSDPMLDSIACWALIFQRRFEEAQNRLVPASGDGRDKFAASEPTLQRAVIAALRDDMQAGTDLASVWLSLNPNKRSFQAGAAWTVRAFNLKSQGKIPEAQAALRDAHCCFNRVQSSYGAVWAHLVGALALVKTGRHRDALVEIDSGVHLCREGGLEGMQSMLSAVEAYVRYERNELAKARNLLDDALPLLAAQGVVDSIVLGYTAAARLRAAEGNLGAALDQLSEAERSGQQRNFHRLSLILRSERALILVRNGAPGQARETAELAGIRLDGASSERLTQDRAGRLFARIALTEGDAEQALGILAPMLVKARLACNQYKRCELLILIALAQALGKNSSAAYAALAEALEIAVVEGYFRIFVDEGAELQVLLSRWLEANTRSKLLTDPAALCAVAILSKMERADLGASEGVTRSAMFTSLSKRELQLLNLINDGLSNAEIAARCFLVEGTVKWHLHNLYGKLGVNSRTAALREAKYGGVLKG